MSYYVADFETTPDPADCRVWAYGIVEVGKENNFTYGNNIDDFMSFCADKKNNHKIFFHNLKFDGNFIIAWLLKNGFKEIPDASEAEEKTFSICVTDEGIFYNIQVYFDVDRKMHKRNKVTFYDSLKILNFSVEQIAKDFGFEEQKEHIEFCTYRPPGHELTPDEVKYLKNDCVIVSRALNGFFEHGLHKMTIGSNAMFDFKRDFKGFYGSFPVLSQQLDAEIRKSYRGGFTWLNPNYKDVVVKNLICLDVNSEYPSVMYEKLLPVGYPIGFKGKYIEDPLYPLYIIAFSCEFKLKPGKIPTVYLRESVDLNNTEYLESSNGLIVPLIMTSIDYELFKENYDISDITFTGGYKFHALQGIFTNYIHRWLKRKQDAKRDGNLTQYQVSKIMLNSLYGKFGVMTKNLKKKVQQASDGSVEYINIKGFPRRSIYTAMASFITAYGREKVIRTAQAVRNWSIQKYGEDFYIYSDTDSIHIRYNNYEEDLKELSKFISIDDNKLGSWKIERRCSRGLFHRSKCYIEEDSKTKKNTVVMAGFPKNLTPLINFDNLKIGFSTSGLDIDALIDIARENGASDDEIKKIHRRLKYKYCAGGVILENSEFTIKD